MNKTPGVDMTSGSLGNGLSAGIGMALYAKAKRKRFQVYVMVGDGELQEGVIWEAILQAGNYRLDNLVCIVDYNHFQSCGCVDDIMPLHPLEDKWRAFGWEVLSANGHNMADVCNKLAIAAMFLGKPVVIVAHTVKGKGVSYMEQNNDWHQKRPTESEYDQAMRELGEVKAYA